MKRKKDFYLLLMLVASFIISLLVAYVSITHLENYPNSKLKIIIQIFGTAGTIRNMDTSESAKFYAGLFFLPFTICGIISFCIYRKFLKGKIE